MNASIVSENVISVLALIEFISIILILLTNSKLRKDFSQLDSKYKKVKIKNESLEQNDSIIPGDKAHFTASLTFTDSAEIKHSFKVIYEVDILEVSHDKVKISPYGVKPEGRLPTELAASPTHNKNLIDFQKDKWVNKNEISTIMSVEEIRDRRINKLID